MSIWPVEHFHISTFLPPQEVLITLASHTEEKKLFCKKPAKHKLYEGKILNDRFIINPIYVPQGSEDINSSLPILIGKVAATNLGSTIDIKMRMHNFVIIFMFIWFGCLAGFGVRLFLLRQTDFTLDHMGGITLMTILGLGFLYLLFRSFHTQANEQHDLLLGLFQKPNEYSNSLEPQ